MQEKIEAERQSNKSVIVPKTFSSPHRIVVGWAQDSRREQQVSRYDAWSPSLYTAIDKTEIDKRRLHILSALFKTLEERGYKLNAGESYRQPVQIGLEHEKLEITLEERIRQARRYLSDEEKARYGYSVASQKWTQEKIATGELILKIKESDLHGSDKEWRETAEAPLEDKLSDIVAEIAGLFEAIRLRRVRVAEERERRWKLEEQRRLAEMERKRETIRYRRLIGNCGDWRTAADIRAFVAAIETSSLGAQNTEAFTGWKLWALADRIDPLQLDDLFDLKVEDHEVYSLRDINLLKF